MTRDLLTLRCPARPDVLDALVPALAGALDGTGPPLALLPEDPPDDLVAAVRPDLPVDADEAAVIVTTSGSTGEPKGVLLPAASLLASATATLAHLGGQGQWLLALPAQYVAGLQVVVRSVVGGTAAVAQDTADGFTAAGFAAATARLRPGGRHYTALVPTQLARLLDDPAGVTALAGYDAVLIGGSAASDDLLDRARGAGVAVVTTYGMSETCGGCVYDGRPLPGVVPGVRDDDRLRLAGPVLASGYRLRPDLTASAFELADDRRWHVTPDVGRVAADGRVEVHGRADHVAVSGGVNVPLAAVERALVAHPAVSAAACVAVDDPRWGQRVVAVVASDATDLTLTAIREHVASTCPRTWAPRELVRLPDLPMLTSGKVDRRVLSQLLADGRP